MIDKTLYKVLLIILKYTPIVLLIVDLISTTLSYYEINVKILDYFGGVSFMTLLILYILSCVFQFCLMYRLSLYYITLSNIIALIDVYIGIPLSDLNILRFYWILFGAMLIVLLCNKRKNVIENDQVSASIGDR